MKIDKAKPFGTEDFNWLEVDKYHARRKRIPNPRVLEKHGAVIYSHEPYALDMYEAIFLSGEVGNKEVTEGEARKIIDVLYVKGSEVQVVLEGMVDCTLDFRSEKLFSKYINRSTSEILEQLQTAEGISSFVQQGYQVNIEGLEPHTRGSISKGVINQVRADMFSQLKNPTTAYICKVLEKNGGGFLIETQGIRGFLPGSLAATNIVRDFDAMIGKELPVVVEDYLKESDTFVFSYKKYVSMVLPTQIDELDTNKVYQGTVTGVTKFGVFIEFNEIFTGLLHTSKMTPECKSKFEMGEFKPGVKFDAFWIKEISNDKKLILTDEDPSIKIAEMEDFCKKNVGTIQGGKVVAVQPFGTLVKLQKEICGLISQKEIKLKKKKLAVGDTVMVSIDSVKKDKVFLSLPAES